MEADSGLRRAGIEVSFFGLRRHAASLRHEMENLRSALQAHK